MNGWADKELSKTRGLREGFRTLAELEALSIEDRVQTIVEDPSVLEYLWPLQQLSFVVGQQAEAD